MKYVYTIIFFISSISSSAKTYYIDPFGSDATGKGTQGNPWKSLYNACNSVITAVDTIHVNAGTYIETAKSTLYDNLNHIHFSYPLLYNKL